ncbi:uncharacterized protein LOC117169070 [Belonocnema kinseyi]|uniref:uncharacterized protein LOC117169070 n=1 Tax=Belonocnema kinseyi TaxID=2817044 RepID=UPI00143CE948|nr:uncharacterized protein LOC117169070 [Belonocnema kinseyi]
MVIHLNRIAVLYAAFSFTALGSSAAPGPTDDNSVVPKELECNKGARLVLYDGTEVSWETKIANVKKVSLSIDGDGSFTLSNKETNEEKSSELKADSYHGKMVRQEGDDSPKTTVWLVGADGKRRLIENRETFQCLKGVGLEDPISVSSNILDQLPNIEGAFATCGTNILRPNEALQQGSYLKAGDYKLLLTNSDLIHTKNGNQIWAPNAGGAQLILQTDGNLVTYDSTYKATWSSQTYLRSTGMLVLGDDGSLRLFDAKKIRVWQP